MTGIKALAAAILECKAMATVNVMGNEIGKEQLSKLQEMMQAHPTLVSLCGIANDAKEANLSGLKMDGNDAAILAAELPAKGALTCLNISDNKLTNYGRDMSGIKALAAAIAKCKALVKLDASNNDMFGRSNKSAINAWADVLKTNSALLELNLAKNHMHADDAKIFANGVSTNGALASLDLSQNNIPAEEMGRIEGLCESKQIALRK